MQETVAQSGKSGKGKGKEKAAETSDDENEAESSTAGVASKNGIVPFSLVSIFPTYG